MMQSGIDASSLLQKADTATRVDQPKGNAKSCRAMQCHESSACAEKNVCVASGRCKRRCCWKAKLAFVVALPLLPIIVPLMYVRYKCCGGKCTKRNCCNAEVTAKDSKGEEDKGNESKAEEGKVDESKA